MLLIAIVCFAPRSCDALSLASHSPGLLEINHIRPSDSFYANMQHEWAYRSAEQAPLVRHLETFQIDRGTRGSQHKVVSEQMWRKDHIAKYGQHPESKTGSVVLKMSGFECDRVLISGAGRAPTAPAQEDKCLAKGSLSGSQLYDPVTGEPTVPRENRTKKSVKLVIGILSLPWEVELRNEHRRTWMRQAGICHISQWKNESCHVFPVFILGNTMGHDDDNQVSNMPGSTVMINITERPSNDQAREDDRIVHIKRNTKICSWFKYARDNFKWASHVAKMDMDTFPAVAKIRYDLAVAPSTAVYYGPFMGYGENCLRGGMQGQFFAVTPDLIDVWVPKASTSTSGTRFARNGREVNDLKNPAYSRTGQCRVCEADGSSTFAQYSDPALGPCLFAAQELEFVPRMTCVDARSRFRHPV